MNYTTAIEQLDQKMGRSITIADWKAISEKPGASLTDDDITVCGYFGGATAAAAARARRDAALRPPDPPPAPVATKAIETKAPPPATPDEFLQRYGSKTVTYKALFGVTDVLMVWLKKHKDRMNTLEQANKDLEARVLELEAQHAAATLKVGV